MKKIVLMASLLFAGVSANAQGLYGELSVGYGIGSSSVLGTERTSNGTTQTEKNIYGTLGSGLNLTLTPGFMLSENFGVELGFNYFMGNEVTVDSYTFPGVTSMKATAQSNQIRLIPSLVFNTGGDKLFAYSKVGLVAPVGGKTTGTRTVEGTGSPTIIASTTSKGAMSIGFRGAFGVGYNLSDNLGLNFEVFHTSLSIKSKTRTLDSYTVGGTDMTGVMKTYDKEINYVDELSATSNNSSFNPNFNAGAAEELLATKTNFNQFGFSIGVKYRF